MSGGLAGLLLAAGGGQRLGMPKALVRLGGETLVERGVRALREAGCEPVVVVLGAAADRVVAGRDLGGARVVVNRDWASGMASSLRVGLDALAATGAGAAVVTLVDQPLVGAAAVRRLHAAWRAGARVAAATYAGAKRNPVLFDRAVWADVGAAAAGDEGARPWLRANAGAVVGVACEDVASPVDVDTPDDLQALELTIGTP